MLKRNKSSNLLSHPNMNARISIPPVLVVVSQDRFNLTHAVEFNKYQPFHNNIVTQEEQISQSWTKLQILYFHLSKYHKIWKEVIWCSNSKISNNSFNPYNNNSHSHKELLWTMVVSSNPLHWKRQLPLLTLRKSGWEEFESDHDNNN